MTAPHTPETTTPQGGPSTAGQRSASMGLISRDAQGGGEGLVLGGLGASVLWVALCGLYASQVWSDLSQAPLSKVMLGMIASLPLVLIWVGVFSARAAHRTRAETERLSSAVDALRQAYVAQVQQGRSEQVNPALIKRLDGLATSQRNLEKTMAMLGTAHLTEAQNAAPIPTPVPLPRAPEDQPALSLGTPAEALEPPLSNADYIRALHFPETAEDQEGFSALRRALKHRQIALLVQASQDVLTLLSQDGIYMDDLRPDPARPEVWRAFAKGARGREVAGLGGLRDRSSLALSSGRMKTDPVFRDSVHHFLRRFDVSFAEFEAQASDAELSEFSNTRTARAFMLLGRVAGTFD